MKEPRFTWHDLLGAVMFGLGPHAQRTRRFVLPTVALWVIFTGVGASLVELPSEWAKAIGALVLFAQALVGGFCHGHTWGTLDSFNKSLDDDNNVY